MLCSPCNQAVGLLKNSPKAMLNGADYLERHQARYTASLAA